MPEKNNKGKNRAEIRKNAVQQFEAQERKRNIILVVIIVVIVVALLGSVVWFAQKTKVDKNTKLIKVSSATRDFGLIYKPSDAGNKKTNADDVKAHLIVYEDFSCPFCGQFEQASGDTMRSLVEDGQADIEYRLVSYLDQGSPTNHSTRAANAALCVLDESNMTDWEKYHDWLFKIQPEEGSSGPKDGALIEGAKKTGVPIDDECVRSEKYVPWMEKATIKFQKSRVTGTPYVEINGKEIKNKAPQAIVSAVKQANEEG